MPPEAFPQWTASGARGALTQLPLRCLPVRDCWDRDLMGGEVARCFFRNFLLLSFHDSCPLLVRSTRISFFFFCPYSPPRLEVNGSRQNCNFANKEPLFELLYSMLRQMMRVRVRYTMTVRASYGDCKLQMLARPCGRNDDSHAGTFGDWSSDGM